MVIDTSNLAASTSAAPNPPSRHVLQSSAVDIVTHGRADIGLHDRRATLKARRDLLALLQSNLAKVGASCTVTVPVKEMVKPEA